MKLYDYKVKIKLSEISLLEADGFFGIRQEVPKISQIKPPKDAKADYKNFMTESTRIRQALSHLADSDVIELMYSNDTGKTYKLFGMDVDENGYSVINISTGKILIDNLADPKAVEDFAVSNRYFERNHRYLDNDTLFEVLRSLNSKDLRTLITAIKMGKGLEMCKSGDVLPVLRTVDKLNPDIKSDSLNKSIIINLIKGKKSNEDSINGSNEEREAINSAVFGCIASYWRSCISNYNQYYTALAGLDLFCALGRAVIGSTTFNNTFSNAFSFEDVDTGEVEKGRIISFNGVSRNGSVSNDNVIRDSCYDALSDVCNLSSRDRYSEKPKAEDLLIGCFDIDGIDDVYELTPDEMQAMSVLDGLANVDDDAEVVKESYDLNDPDERGLFVKSAIRSYDKHFREFKPGYGLNENNYSADAMETLADLVDKGDLEVAKPVSMDVYTDEVGDVVTSTTEEIKATFNKKDLVKVMKLINKSTTGILKSFG